MVDQFGDIDRPILAAHSAAGLLLPSLAARTDAAMLIFMDARVPPSDGRVAPADAEFLRFIDTRVLPTSFRRSISCPRNAAACRPGRTGGVHVVCSR